MKNRRLLPILLLAGAASVLTASGALADGDHPMSEGTVRKVDLDQSKITIKHGPIANLEMPPMTMVFGVKDPGVLESVQEGDTVAFYVVDEGGKMMIEELERR